MAKTRLCKAGDEQLSQLCYSGEHCIHSGSVQTLHLHRHEQGLHKHGIHPWDLQRLLNARVMCCKKLLSKLAKGQKLTVAKVWVWIALIGLGETFWS